MSLRIDAHHHLWDLSITPQEWLTKSMPEINRSFLVPDLMAATAGRIDWTVIVQTASDEAETMWMLDQAEHSELIGAVVGWVDLTSVDVEDRLARLTDSAHGRWLAGIRHQVHDEPDFEWVTRADVQRGVRAVGGAGLVFDLLVRPAHLDAAYATARALEDVSFCVDHIAKPRIAAGDLDEWSTGIKRLASLPNVSCKLSGMVTEADWKNWTVDDIRPFAEVVIDAFGPNRVMFGSDWPVCLPAASYGDVHDLTVTLLDSCSPSDREQVHGKTAQRVYGRPGKGGIETQSFL